MLTSNCPCVLVAEDDPDWLEAMRQSCSAQGFNVQAVSSVSEALLRVSRQKYSALIVDMRFVRAEGEKIIEQVRASPHGFNFTTPILVVSGTLDTELALRIAPKINGVLVKPVAAPEVAEKTQALIAATAERTPGAGIKRRSA